jgi:uncharacterized membrane protein YfcA
MILVGVKTTLTILLAYFAIVFARDYVRTARQQGLGQAGFLSLGAVGFITNFFDTLGIGSYAPTTALFKYFRLTADRTIPGTLNASCAVPAFFQAMIFMTVIKVEPLTLVTMLVAATTGSVLGAGFVSKLDERKVRIGLGCALCAVALVMLAGQVQLMPRGGTAIGLPIGKLAFAAGVNFLLGALMTIGVGLYAPCMALVYALGMIPAAAFPIMTSSCAFLQSAASIKFIKAGAYDRKATLAIALFGSVGVFIAGYIVKSLPLRILKWLVIIVILFTAAMMFKAAFHKEGADRYRGKGPQL